MRFTKGAKIFIAFIIGTPLRILAFYVWYLLLQAHRWLIC